MNAVAFTDKGLALAKKLADRFGGKAYRCKRGSLDDWTRDAFEEGEAIVFVGACGIAVRAIAPHIMDKASDPPVVVMDEDGKFAIPILSGHIGGANTLARTIATYLGAQPVITTATDVAGVFAIDEWASQNGCVVRETGRIADISSTLLLGERVGLICEYGKPDNLPESFVYLPDGSSGGFKRGVVIGHGKAEPFDVTLHVEPRNVWVGIGCKRGVLAKSIEEAYVDVLKASGVARDAVRGVATIDMKRNDLNLVGFCEKEGLRMRFCSADELKTADGKFSQSAFVQSVTGVDCVCERAAVLASGGRLIAGKRVGNGVTVALAEEKFKAF